MGEYRYKKQLIKVVKECENQNYFRFNNKFYIQKKRITYGIFIMIIVIVIIITNTTFLLKLV